MRLIPCLLVLLAASLLAACGNKGPLTLPRSESAVSPAGATSATAPAAPASTDETFDPGVDAGG